MGIYSRGSVDVDLEKHHEMLWKSTADTEACGRIGAILGKGTGLEVDSLAKFGRRLGFYRRLLGNLRDCLNVEGNLTHRLKNETVPLSILYAAKTSNEANTQIRSILAKPAIAPEDIRQLVKICFKTHAFNYVSKIAEKNFSEAKANLKILKPSFARDALALLNRRLSAEIHRLCH